MANSTSDDDSPDFMQVASVRPPTLPDLTGVDPERKQQILEFYEKSVSLYHQQQRQILQMRLRQNGMATNRETIYREEKQFKKKAKTDDKDKMKLHKFWSVGAKVEVQKNGATKSGVITNYDDENGEYEVTFSDGVVSWKTEDQITLVPVVLRRRATSLSRSGSDYKVRSASPSSDSNRDNSEDESGESSGESSGSSGDGMNVKKRLVLTNL
jgi:hypothetical protein